MKVWLYRILGSILILGAVFGFLVSVGGLVYLWMVKPEIEQQVERGVNLLSRTIDATDALLQVVDDSLGQAETSLDGIEIVIDELAGTISETAPIIYSVADILGQDVVTVIQDTQAALVSAEASAGVIDNTLQLITAITSLNPFQRTPAYAPEVPLQDSLAMMSASLESLPSSLADVETGLDITAMNLGDLQLTVMELSGNIGEIRTSLGQAQAVVGEYQVIIEEARTGVSTLEARLKDLINVVVWGTTMLLIWLGIAQIGLFTQGLELFFRRN